MVQYGVPALVLGFLVVGVAVPMVRLYVRHGAFGFVGHRARDPKAAAVALSFVALLVGAVGWSAALVAAGPDALGIFEAPAALHAAGLVVMALGVVLCAVAQAQMGASWRIGVGDQPTALVAHGLYAASRHPIYSALGLYVLGVALAAPSWATWAACAGGFGVLAIEARLEERHLLEVHGEAYRAYARRVGRFVPWFGRLR